MKKIVFLVMIGFISLFFVSCGGGGSSDGYSTDKSESLDIRYGEGNQYVAGWFYINPGEIFKSILDDNSSKKEVVLNNFKVSLGSCNVSYYFFGRETGAALPKGVLYKDEIAAKTEEISELILKDDKNQRMIVYAETTKPCYSANMVVSADRKLVTDGSSIKDKFEAKLPIRNVSEEPEVGYSIEHTLKRPLKVNSTSLVQIRISDKKTKLNVQDFDVISVNISSNDTSKLVLLNESFQEVSNIEYSKIAQKDIVIKTKGISNLANLTIKAKIKTSYGTEDINQNLQLAINQGNTTSFSMSYVSTNYDSGAGKLESTYTIFATDKNGMISNVLGGSVDMGVISEFKVFGNDAKIKPLGSQTEFRSDLIDPQLVEYKSGGIKDKIVLISNEAKENIAYLGGWDISQIAKGSIISNNQYDGLEDDKISYIIGDEDMVQESTRTNVAIVIDPSKTQFKFDSNGNLKLVLSYPKYFIGKYVYIYFSTKDNNNKRVGQAMQVLIPGVELEENSSAQVFKFSNSVNGNKEGPAENIWTVFGYDANTCVANNISKSRLKSLEMLVDEYNHVVYANTRLNGVVDLTQVLGGKQKPAKKDENGTTIPNQEPEYENCSTSFSGYLVPEGILAVKEKLASY